MTTVTASAERRALTFDNLRESVEDVERLASGEVRTTGNHTFGQILNHLALSIDVATGRVDPPPPPFFMKLMMPLMKRMVINDKPLKAGMKLPEEGEAFFWPDKEFEDSAAVQYYKEAVEYFNTTGPLEKHPYFGKLTKGQIEQLECRHAALHLSFVQPA